jgi:hypothetical protein
LRARGRWASYGVGRLAPSRLRHYRDCTQTNVAPRLCSQLATRRFSRIGVHLADSEIDIIPLQLDQPAATPSVPARQRMAVARRRGLDCTLNFAFDAPSMTGEMAAGGKRHDATVTDLGLAATFANAPSVNRPYDGLRGRT